MSCCFSMAHSVVHLQKPYTIIKEMEFEGACSKKMDANPVAVVEAWIYNKVSYKSLWHIINWVED